MIDLPDYDNSKKWINLLKNYIPGVGWLFLFVLIVFILTKPETVFHWVSKIQRLFLWLGNRFKRTQIETTIKANILKVSKEASRELGEVMPYDLKINWIKESDRETFLDGKNVVVCMDNNRNKTHNVVHAVNDYVHTALLNKEKSCLDDNTYKASCLVMTRKLLMTSTYEEGASYFFENIMNYEIEKDEFLKKSISKLIDLDDNGQFVQVMIRELKNRSEQVFGKTENSAFVLETKGFISFLHNIATRDVGDDTTNLNFNGKYYKVGVILVANLETYNTYKEEGYVRRFIQHKNENKDSIYLLGKNYNLSIVKDVVKEIKQKDRLSGDSIKYIKEFHYKGINKKNNKYSGLIIHIKLNNELSDIRGVI